MTKTINITVEVYDGTKTEEIERIVSAALDNNGIDCTYDVKDMEDYDASKEIYTGIGNGTVITFDNAEQLMLQLAKELCE